MSFSTTINVVFSPFLTISRICHTNTCTRSEASSRHTVCLMRCSIVTSPNRTVSVLFLCRLRSAGASSVTKHFALLSTAGCQTSQQTPNTCGCILTAAVCASLHSKQRWFSQLVCQKYYTGPAWKRKRSRPFKSLTFQKQGLFFTCIQPLQKGLNSTCPPRIYHILYFEGFRNVYNTMPICPCGKESLLFFID